MDAKLANGLWIFGGVVTLFLVAYSLGENAGARRVQALMDGEIKQLQRWDAKWVEGTMVRTETNSGRVQVFNVGTKQWVEIGKSPAQQFFEDAEREAREAQARFEKESGR